MIASKLIKSSSIPVNQIQARPGNCLIILGAGEGQTSLGPFTIAFDSGDVLTNVSPGDSYYFDNDYQFYTITSANPADAIVQVQAGYGRKYQLGDKTTIINPDIVVDTVGRNVDTTDYTFNVPPNSFLNNVGAGDLTNLLGVWCSVNPTCPSGVYVLMFGAYSGAAVFRGFFVKPGDSVLIPWITSPNGIVAEYSFSNPFASQVTGTLIPVFTS